MIPEKYDNGTLIVPVPVTYEIAILSGRAVLLGAETGNIDVAGFNSIDQCMLDPGTSTGLESADTGAVYGKLVTLTYCISTGTVLAGIVNIDDEE